MSRSRPASNPLSYHKHTGQYYVTRSGKRVYLGVDRDEALAKTVPGIIAHQSALKDGETLKIPQYTPPKA